MTEEIKHKYNFGKTKKDNRQSVKEWIDRKSDELLSALRSGNKTRLELAKAINIGVVTVGPVMSAARKKAKIFLVGRGGRAKYELQEE